MKPRLIISQNMIEQWASVILADSSLSQDFSIQKHGKLLTRQQVASYLGVCERTVKHYIRQQVLTGFQLGSLWFTYELILHRDLMNLYLSQNKQ